MSDGHVQYLIIGAGTAGDAAAESIREIDSAGSMMLVGQEINRPYHRHQLAGDYLLGTLDHESLFMHAPGWYAQQHIELRTGRIASHLDTSRQVVTLDDASEISFDSLLIATGATPRRLVTPGSELPNVYYLHSIADAERLRHAALKSFREGQGRSVVIGGTLLAVELAATLKQIGLHVDLICDAFGTLVGESAASIITRALVARDVAAIGNAHPLRFDGDGRVQRVVLDNGQTIATDLVVAAIEGIPNKQLLRTTPIRSENAILADEQCRTNVPNIFAAGECAVIYDPRFGKHRHLIYEPDAAETGRLAGRNMAGKDESFAAVNYVEREIFDLPLLIAGEQRLVHHRLVRAGGSEEQPALLEFGLAVDGRLAQIVALGKTPNRQILLELIKQRISLWGHEESIKDPSFDLNTLII
jgi:NADPH-dependent 2,4-dienoyl-CoA reductase/sulfur reductase-like enzyme